MKALYATACLLAAGLCAAPPPARGADVAALLERLDRQMSDFEDVFDEALEKTVLDDTALANRLEDQAEELEDEIGNLKSDYHGGKDARQVRERLDRALVRAGDINNVMLQRRFATGVHEQWEAIRAGLNELAAAYGLRPLQTR